MKALAPFAAFLSLLCAAAFTGGLSAHADDWQPKALVLLLAAGVVTAAAAIAILLLARRRGAPAGRATVVLVALAIVTQIAVAGWVGSVHVRALGFRALRAAYTLGMARDLPGWPPESR